MGVIDQRPQHVAVDPGGGNGQFGFEAEAAWQRSCALSRIQGTVRAIASAVEGPVRIGGRALMGPAWRGVAACALLGFQGECRRLLAGFLTLNRLN